MNIIMPQLGETVTEGTVTKWYKKVGDTVKADETLFDIETDKVSTEIPSPVVGVVSEICVEAGVTAKVGVTLAVITEPGAVAKPQAAPVAAVPVAVAVVAERVVGGGRQGIHRVWADQLVHVIGVGVFRIFGTRTRPEQALHLRAL